MTTTPTKPMKVTTHTHALVKRLCDEWSPLQMKDAVELGARIALTSPREKVQLAMKNIGRELTQEELSMTVTTETIESPTPEATPPASPKDYPQDVKDLRRIRDELIASNSPERNVYICMAIDNITGALDALTRRDGLPQSQRYSQ